jgi:hypothetical protein
MEWIAIYRGLLPGAFQKILLINSTTGIGVTALGNEVVSTSSADPLFYYSID